jgi:hypothetical protein
MIVLEGLSLSRRGGCADMNNNDNAGGIMTDQSNMDRLTAAGIIPKGYDKLTAAEQATINGMSAAEVEAVISAASKLGHDFMKKHAPHGMVY